MNRLLSQRQKIDAIALRNQNLSYSEIEYYTGVSKSQVGSQSLDINIIENVWSFRKVTLFRDKQEI